MPHDKNDQELKVGDRVVIEAIVTEISQTDEFCNVNLETTEVMYPSNNRTLLVLNAKQVQKVIQIPIIT